MYPRLAYDNLGAQRNLKLALTSRLEDPDSNTDQQAKACNNTITCQIMITYQDCLFKS